VNKGTLLESPRTETEVEIRMATRSECMAIVRAAFNIVEELNAMPVVSPNRSPSSHFVLVRF